MDEGMGRSPASKRHQRPLTEFLPTPHLIIYFNYFIYLFIPPGPGTYES